MLAQAFGITTGVPSSPSDVIDQRQQVLGSEVVDQLRLLLREPRLMQPGIEFGCRLQQLVADFDPIFVGASRYAKRASQTLATFRIVVVRERHHRAKLALEFHIGLQQRVRPNLAGLAVPELVGNARGPVRRLLDLLNEVRSGVHGELAHRILFGRRIGRSL